MTSITDSDPANAARKCSNLNGVFIDFQLNTDNGAVILTDSMVYVANLPTPQKSTELKLVSLPLDSLYFKDDINYCNIGYRVWWLFNDEYILFLAKGYRWVIFKRLYRSVQWEKCTDISETLDTFFVENKNLNSVDFVDLVVIGKVKRSVDIHEVKVTCEEVKPTKGSYIIDEDSMPDRFQIGTFSFRKRNKKHKVSMFKPKVKREQMKQETDESENESIMQPITKPDKTVIKQIVAKSTSGAERLVTYVGDREGEVEDRGEEKVACVCGATEENSSEEEDWVECDLCHVWQHVDCVGYYPEVQTFYHCQGCIAKQEKMEKKPKVTSGKKRGRPKKQDSISKPKFSKSPEQSDGVTKQLISPAPTNPSQEVAGPSQVAELYFKDEPGSSGEDDEVGNLESDSSHGVLHHGNHINCPCGASESESGEEWVQCEECEKWQHQLCVNYANEDSIKYRCPSCQQVFSYFSQKTGKLDGFMVVGKSSFRSAQETLQPVYVALERGIKKCMTSDNSAVKTLSTQKQLENTSSSVESPRTPSVSPMEECVNVVKTVNNTESNELDSEDYSFLLSLYSNFLLIIRCESHDLDTMITSCYQLDGRSMSMFTVRNCESHLKVAMFDYTTDSIVSWTMVHSNSTLIPTAESLLQLGGCIERLMWVSDTHLVTLQCHTVTCHNMMTSSVTWSHNINLSSVTSWTLTGSNLTLHDSAGSEVMVSAQTGQVLQEMHHVGSKDIVLHTTTSSRNLLKFTVSVGREPVLGFNTSCVLQVSVNEMGGNRECEGRGREVLLYNQLTNKTGDAKPTPSAATPEPTPDTSPQTCVICNDPTLTPTPAPLTVTCSNSHILYTSRSGMVLDPFTMVQCEGCQGYNSDGALVCEFCGTELEAFKYC